MGILDHLTCLLRNLYAGREATVRIGHGTTDWFQIRKGVRQVFILSLCLFTYMQSTSCEMSGWMKHKLESRLPGKYQSPQICRWHHPYGRKQRGTKEPLDESERGEWKVGLKLKIQKTKIMASSPITSWQTDAETVEMVRDYFGGAPKSLQMVTATMKLKDACSLKEKLWPT